jgi:hypothetical protein
MKKPTQIRFHSKRPHIIKRKNEKSRAQYNRVINDYYTNENVFENNQGKFHDLVCE